MNLFDFLGPAASGGATFGAVLGFVGLAGLVGVKQWQDRDLLRPQISERRDRSREARAQSKVLGQREVQGHTPASIPGAGQWASRKRKDGPGLS